MMGLVDAAMSCLETISYLAPEDIFRIYVRADPPECSHADKKKCISPSRALLSRGGDGDRLEDPRSGGGPAEGRGTDGTGPHFNWKRFTRNCIESLQAARPPPL